jgi:hypothetical protein
VRAQQLVQQRSVIEGGRSHPLTPGWELMEEGEEDGEQEDTVEEEEEGVEKDGYDKDCDE